MGTTKIFLTYIGNANGGVVNLYSAADRDAIDQYMNWFESVLRPSARRVIKTILYPEQQN